jgi:serine/threonine protein kinase
VTGQQALGSRYVLEGRIGSGGMGAVWRGRDRGNGLPVAVKLLHEQFAADPAVLTRFVRERTVLVGLRHPNLVPVHDMIMEGDRLALIMELVQGADLHHHLNARGPLPPALAATLIAQVCDALAVVHAAGVIHRDLKPSNILLDTSRPAPAARLTDFGIAWADDAVSLTSDGAVVGTPAYFAPEVVTGQRGGPAADVYAAGTSLFELLAGISAQSTSPVVVNTWVHLVGVYDAHDKQLRLYVNGKPQGTATDATPYAANGSLAIGRAQFGAQDIGWFPGRINDVEVFQEALTPAEVKAL